MKRTILLVFSGECHQLPPLLSILDSLHSDYLLKVISYETSEKLQNLRQKYPDVIFLSKVLRPNKESFFDKVVRHLYFPIRFHCSTKRLIKNETYDLLWIIHERTLIEFQKYLPEKKYIVSFYELNDHDKGFVRKTKVGVSNALTIITCEYNRSCIMRVWYHLDYTPPIIPNKPYYHPRKRFIDCEFSKQLEGKKIIIFQGYIQRVRNIDKLCEAVEGMPEFTLVLMGGGDSDYIEELKSRFSNIIFTGYVIPPYHMNITSYAYIGVVKYDHIFLDHTFCAPNKIWEYSGFGIPTLGNDLPGLEYTIGKAKAGVCVSFDNVDSIRNGILEIERDYENYSKHALSFYDSFDLKKTLLDICTRYIVEQK